MPSLRSSKTNRRTKFNKDTQNVGKDPTLAPETDALVPDAPEPDAAEPGFTLIEAQAASEEMLQLAAEAEQNVPPEERNSEWPICVPGRLGLIGSKRGKNYLVTEEEIKRRIGQPEGLSGSAVCQYLKRRRQSTSLPRGIVMPKRKKSKDSLFSLLTEGEAVDLASDFGHIIKEEKFFNSLCQSVAETDKQSVRNAAISMLEALETMDSNQANIRQHGFLIPVARQVLSEIYAGLDIPLPE